MRCLPGVHAAFAGKLEGSIYRGVYELRICIRDLLSDLFTKCLKSLLLDSVKGLGNYSLPRCCFCVLDLSLNDFALSWIFFDVCVFYAGRRVLADMQASVLCFCFAASLT